MNESDLSLYSFGARVGYQLLIWPIVTLGALGNLTVLWRVIFSIGQNSTLKPMYRGALLSLATSDLLLLASSGYNVLSTFIRPNILWVLPDLLCSLIPCLQTTAALACSLTLAVVAADRVLFAMLRWLMVPRTILIATIYSKIVKGAEIVLKYRAIKPRYPPPTGPRWPMVAVFIIVIWGIAIGATYPVADLYATQTVIVITNVTYYRASVCATTDRQRAATIYVALYVTIFLPLAIIFVGVHVLLALKIRGQERRGIRSTLAASGDSQFTETTTATTSTAGSSPIALRRSPTALPPFGRRKQRTVKVILTLILFFILCRLPMWTFAVIKLHVTLSGRVWWHVQAVVTTLSLANTVTNPILYTFINETFSIFSWIRSCCKKTDEADLDTRTPENVNSNVASIKVPRGPYSP